jgi:hypothetical protein
MLYKAMMLAGCFDEKVGWHLLLGMFFAVSQSLLCLPGNLARVPHLSIIIVLLYGCPQHAVDVGPLQ